MTAFALTRLHGVRGRWRVVGEGVRGHSREHGSHRGQS